jgi:hypothetical protein
MKLGLHGSIINIRSNLPTCVLPSYWKRHSLSRRDIDAILAYVPTKVIWMSALLCGIPCPWFSLRSSAASKLEVTFSGKSLAVDLLLKQSGMTPSTDHKLDLCSIESLEHIPPIPKDRIGEFDFLRLSTGIISHLLPRSLLSLNEPITEVPILYEYKGGLLLPVGLEGDSICCNVVIPEDIYCKYRLGTGITHQPQVCIYQDIVYCLTDELVLVCP